MEIIHLVLGKVNPQRMNGVNKVVYELATRQHAAGMNVKVWGITRHAIHDYPDRNFVTRLFVSVKNPFGLDSSLKEALKKLSGNTVVHLHGGFIPAFYSVAKILKRRGIPFVLTPHGSYNTVALLKGRFKKMWYLPLFEKQLIHQAHTIHSLGKSEVDGLLGLMPGKNSALIPYGFEADELTEVYAQRLNKSYRGHQMISCFCGRLDVHTKGLDAAAEAFAKLCALHDDVCFWIIGDSTERTSLEQRMEALGIAERVKFWGALYGQDKIDVLKQADVFIHPSRNEGLPTAVLEAAAMGLPSLVTRATNMGELIEEYHAGWVIEDTDPDLLMEAWEKAYQQWKQGGICSFSEKASQMVTYAFDWNRILERMHKMYESCSH
jgi:glycosyltransferase involved in cell wall biosynthesis